MLQRIQTIWLFIALILLVWFPFNDYATMLSNELTINLSVIKSSFNAANSEYNSIGLFGLFAPLVFHFISIIMVAVSIFMYKKRIKQARILTFSIILILATICTIGYNVYCLYGYNPTNSSSISIGYSNVMPIISIILIYLAIRRIYFDEALVRAANRIR